ncbi:MAG TPA: NADPH-dependent 7-cyano-7-deazaguanine reductase QueF, partial [Gammaproteobacteria bacterium]|nr:NADPH-dependent 7-cyano-7-deazaguanine reductase QueF [Gammaproteobacteria bacterium]
MEEQSNPKPQADTIVYVDQYDPNILRPINRDQSRSAIGIDVQDLPFSGVDVWNGFDFTWLNSKNQAEFAMLTIFVPCDSPHTIDSKSLKLYLLSFANSQFQSVNEIITTIKQDLSQLVGM